MSWQNERPLRLWNGTLGGVGMDADGDVGLIDAEGYSIVLSPDGARVLLAWLQEQLPPGSVIPGPQAVCRVRAGWHEAGKVGRVVGPHVKLRQSWTPVLWEGEEDPSWCKTAALELCPAGPQTVALGDVPPGPVHPDWYEDGIEEGENLWRLDLADDETQIQLFAKVQPGSSPPVYTRECRLFIEVDRRQEGGDQQTFYASQAFPQDPGPASLLLKMPRDSVTRLLEEQIRAVKALPCDTAHVREHNRPLLAQARERATVRVQEALAFVTQKRAEGWTKADFAAALGQMLASPDGKVPE